MQDFFNLRNRSSEIMIRVMIAGPSYPMGPLGPGPGPPRLRGPPNSPCIIYYLVK